LEKEKRQRILCMKLLIVESPNKKKTIAEFLGTGWIVEASMGHICDLPLKEIGVQGPNYKPKFELTERGELTINRLKKVAARVDSVWLAMDPDREGEAIAGHIARYLKTPALIFNRVIFHEITAKAVQQAVRHPRKLDRGLFYAQQARRVIDRLVGYQVSPRLSQETNQKLSAGRVQSVAVRLLVEKERAIKAFTVTEHFGARLYFSSQQQEWFANWDTRPFTTEAEPYVLDKQIPNNLLHIPELKASRIAKKPGLRKAPPPFITTTLQKAASILLNINANQTMSMAQTLFEKGLITYHRTDNPNVAEEAICFLQQEIHRLGLGEHIAHPPNFWKAKSGAQEAHEAIRPTDPSRTDSGLDQVSQKLYALIRERAIACQMKSVQFETTVITLQPLDNTFDIQNITPSFIARGTVTLYKGWRLLMAKDDAEEKDWDEENQHQLPLITKNSMHKPIRGEVLELKTQAPKRYTEAALISKLENEGIGRPSTYAAILNNIQQRHYVERKGKVFFATNSAEIIFDALVGKFQFMEIEYTRAMEQALDEIATGKKAYIDVVSAADLALKESLHNLVVAESNGYTCPKCKAPMRKIKGKNGFFWGCSQYVTGCKGTLSIHVKTTTVSKSKKKKNSKVV